MTYLSHKKVISSYASGGPAALQHTLLLALVHNQGQQACDRVDVVEWRFSANAASGEITRDFDTVHSFEATVSAGIPTLCD